MHASSTGARHPRRVGPRCFRIRAGGGGRRVITGALVLVAMLAARPEPARAAERPDASQVKADMLWNIAKFVRWPVGTFDRTRGELVFSILGEDPLAAALAATFSTRTINGRPVFVHFVRRPQDAVGSQILYIAASERGRAGEALRAIEGTPALTVADSAGFALGGGMIGFSSDPDRVRFEINQARAERSGLKISAKLLAVAHVVDATP